MTAAAQAAIDGAAEVTLLVFGAGPSAMATRDVDPVRDRILPSVLIAFYVISPLIASYTTSPWS